MVVSGRAFALNALALDQVPNFANCSKLTVFGSHPDSQIGVDCDNLAGFLRWPQMDTPHTAIFAVELPKIIDARGAYLPASNNPIGGIPVDQQTQTELEAAAFRRLVQHLRDNPDVQNIDLMNLGGFCRNCLSKWYRAAGEERGLAMDYEQAREIIYGMPYADWKSKFQTQATAEQQAAYAARAEQ